MHNRLEGRHKYLFFLHIVAGKKHLDEAQIFFFFSKTLPTSRNLSSLMRGNSFNLKNVNQISSTQFWHWLKKANVSIQALNLNLFIFLFHFILICFGSKRKCLCHFSRLLKLSFQLITSLRKFFLPVVREIRVCYFDFKWSLGFYGLIIFYGLRRCLYIYICVCVWNFFIDCSLMF